MRLKVRALPLFTLMASVLLAPVSACQQAMPPCAPDNAGLTLPSNFCAIVVADDVTRARHLDVAANGDIVVATGPARGQDGGGGVVVLRDSDGDGVTMSSLGTAFCTTPLTAQWYGILGQREPWNRTVRPIPS
jgi:hypothetical protein